MAGEKQIKRVAIATTTDSQEGTSNLGDLETSNAQTTTKGRSDSGAFGDFSPNRDFMATFPLTHRLKRLRILDSLGSAGSLGI
jgi:hypothetical protein